MIEEITTDAVPGGWGTSARNRAMSAARDDLALISAQLNDGHALLVTLMQRVLAEELWCGAGFRSPEHWLTAYAGLTWCGRRTTSSASPHGLPTCPRWHACSTRAG